MVLNLSSQGNLVDQAIPSPFAVPSIDPSATITDAIQAFLDSHIPNPHTRRSYEKHLRDACEIIAVETVGDIQPQHLVMFRGFILADGRGSASHAQALIAFRSFLTWASAMGAHSINLNQAMYLLKVPNVVVIRPHIALTAKEIEKMLAVARKEGPRDHALFMVALGAGLRLSELTHLDCCDIQDDAGSGTVIHVRQGKGSKDRLVPVRPEVRKAVEAYILASGKKIGDKVPLFTGEDRGAAFRGHSRLSNKSAAKIIRTVVEKADINKRVSPHALRHTFAFACYLYSKNIVAVQHLLGHATVNTTLRYVAHLDKLQLRASIPAFLGGVREKPKKPRRKSA